MWQRLENAGPGRPRAVVGESGQPIFKDSSGTVIPIVGGVDAGNSVVTSPACLDGR